MRGVATVVAVVGFGISVGATARADSSVTVTLTPQGQQLEQALMDSPGGLIANVQAKVNALYQLEHLDQLLGAFDKGTVASDRTLGVDFAARDGEAVLGVVGTGIDAGGPKLGASSVSAGELYNLGIFAGVSLARWGLPRVMITANAYYESATVDQLTGHLTTLGGHVQWRALPPRGRWIGLDVTSGVEYVHDEVGAEQPIHTNFTVSGPGGSRNLALVATGTLSLVSTATSIPVLVTTGVRVGPVDFYAGGGADLVFGSTTITAGLAGNLATTAEMTPIGTLNITASGKVSASVFDARALAGIQVEIPYAQVYVQGDAAQTANTVSIGVRAVVR